MGYKLNKNVDRLKIGDKVTTDYNHEGVDIVRTLTFIEKDKQCGSGYRASVDGGEPCKCCGLTKGKPITNVDAAWFVPYIPNN